MFLKTFWSLGYMEENKSDNEFGLDLPWRLWLGLLLISGALLVFSAIFRNIYMVLGSCIVLGVVLICATVLGLSRFAKTGFFLAAVIAIPFLLQNVLNFAVGVRLISSPTLNQGLLRASSVLNGILIFAILSYVLMSGSIRINSSIDKVFLLWIVLGFANLIIGILNHNDLSYLLSDLYKWLIIPMGYYAYKNVIISRKPDIQKLVIFVIMIGAATTLLSGLSSLVLYVIHGHLVIFAANAVDIPFLVFLIFRVSKRNGQSGRKLSYMLLLAVVLIGIISLKRGTWVLIPVAVVAVWLTGSDIRISRVVTPTLAIMAIFAVAFIAFSNGLPSQITSRWQYTFAYKGSSRGYDPSVGERFLEARSAIQEMQTRDNVLDYFTGLGMGAEYYAPTSQIKELGSREGYVHQTHATYVDIFFRQGAAGLILFVALVFALMGMFQRIRKKWRMGIINPDLLEASQVIFASFLVTLVAAVSAVGFVGEIGWAIFLGVFGAIASIEAPDPVSNTR